MIFLLLGASTTMTLWMTVARMKLMTSLMLLRAGLLGTVSSMGLLSEKGSVWADASTGLWLS
jgi:hypothetical protein